MTYLSGREQEFETIGQAVGELVPSLDDMHRIENTPLPGLSQPLPGICPLIISLTHVQNKCGGTQLSPDACV